MGNPSVPARLDSALSYTAALLAAALAGSCSHMSNDDIVQRTAREAMDVFVGNAVSDPFAVELREKIGPQLEAATLDLTPAEILAMRYDAMENFASYLRDALVRLSGGVNV